MKFGRRSKKEREPGGRPLRRNRPGEEHPTHTPDLEPAHDQPWVPRSGLIDRLRRSARR